MKIQTQRETFAYRMAALEEVPPKWGQTQHRFGDLVMRIVNTGKGGDLGWVRAYPSHDTHDEDWIGEITWDNQWDGTVDRVKVHPDHRRKGIATAMYEYLTQLAQEQPGDHETGFIAPDTEDSEYASAEGRAWGKKMLRKRTAAAPKGISFQLSRTGYGNGQPVVYALREDPDWGHINIGELQWHHPDGDPPPGPDDKVNEIKWIMVDPKYQRQGIATAMYEWAKQNANPDLTFSPHMTDKGHAWSKAQGYAPSRWKRFDNHSGSEWVDERTAAFYLYADMNVSTGDPGSGGSSSANSAQMMVNQVYNDQAQSLLSQADGRDYNFGGSGQGSDVVPGGDPLSYDCTGIIGDVKTIYEGGDPNGSYATDATGTRFNTTSDMMGAGFEPGAKPGALNIGINPNPGEAGHAVGQLPSGEKFESSGSDGVEYGSDARSITDRSLSQQYHLPNSELPNTSSPTTTETMLGGGVK